MRVIKTYEEIKWINKKIKSISGIDIDLSNARKDLSQRIQRIKNMDVGLLPFPKNPSNILTGIKISLDQEHNSKFSEILGADIIKSWIIIGYDLVENKFDSVFELKIDTVSICFNIGENRGMIFKLDRSTLNLGISFDSGYVSKYGPFSKSIVSIFFKKYNNKVIKLDNIEIFLTHLYASIYVLVEGMANKAKSSIEKSKREIDLQAKRIEDAKIKHQEFLKKVEAINTYRDELKDYLNELIDMSDDHKIKDLDILFSITLSIPGIHLNKLSNEVILVNRELDQLFKRVKLLDESIEISVVFNENSVFLTFTYNGVGNKILSVRPGPIRVRR